MIQFLDLPTEVIQYIVNHLELSDLLSVAYTCSRLKETVYSSKKLIENCQVHPLTCERTSIATHLSQILSREQIRVLDLYGVYWIPRAQLKTLIIRCRNLEELFVLGTTLNFVDITHIMAQLTTIISLSFVLNNESALSKDNSKLFKNLTHLCIMSQICIQPLLNWLGQENLEKLKIIWLILNCSTPTIIKILQRIFIPSNAKVFCEYFPKIPEAVFESPEYNILIQMDLAALDGCTSSLKRNCAAKIFVWKNNKMLPFDLEGDYLNSLNSIDINDVDKLEIKINGVLKLSELMQWINNSDIQRKIYKMGVTDSFLDDLNNENILNIFSNTPNMEIFELNAMHNKYIFTLSNISNWKNLKELSLFGIRNDMRDFAKVAASLPNLEVLRVKMFSINGIAYYNISIALPKLTNLKEFKYNESISLESLNRMFASLSRCNKIQSVYISINSLGKFNKRDFICNCLHVLQINSLRFFGLVVSILPPSDIQFLRKALKKQTRKEMSIYICSVFDNDYASEFPLYYQARYIRTEFRVCDHTLQNNNFFRDVEL